MASFIRRSRAAPVEPDPWAAYLSGVEPALAAIPRAHVFARPPLLGDAAARAVEMAVWIEEDADADEADRTRRALQDGTRQPVSILAGPLAQALAQTPAEYVALLRAGDIPAPSALERLGQAATMAEHPRLITCDDDRLNPDGTRRSPRFRPGPSPDRWLASDDSGPLLVVRRQVAAQMLSELTETAAWRHELALRLAGPAAGGHAHVPQLLCHQAAERPQAPALSARQTERVLRAWEPSAQVLDLGGVRTVRRSMSKEPSVEVVVCFRDRPELLARCVVSLLARTSYERWGVALVDNGSKTAQTTELLGGLERQRRIRLIRDARPFNFAALNNAAVASSNADVIVFLNNDTEILDADWIETLLEEALRDEVGAVAPMLLYPDGLVQHAGAALGLHGYAGHPFAGLAPDTMTPFGKAAGGTRNWLAVTAACMMVERSKFWAVGGFDETFVIAGNDVDLCLRLTAAGHRSLCVPSVMVMHDESRSRGADIDPGDFVASERSYGAFRTVGDPFYNPNLTTRSTHCSVRQPGE